MERSDMLFDIPTTGRREKRGGNTMRGVLKMAKTKTSIRGRQNKKIVPVKGYTKSNGQRVHGYRRSTPN